MFKIESVNPSGLFSYGIHETICLDKCGSVLLEGINLDRNGNSNGAGKTSIFYAIVHILYGRNPSGEGADTVVNEFVGKYFGQIIFIDKDGGRWRVTDVRKWRKSDKYPDGKLSETYQEEPSEIHTAGLRLSGTDVYLEKWDVGQGIWIDERSSNRKAGIARLDLKATRKKIVDILGVDYDQFMSIAYLAQQQTLKFISGTHKDRMGVIAELSDLKAWDRRNAAIRVDLAEQESEKSRLESKLDGLSQISFIKPNAQNRDLLKSSIDSLMLQIDECDAQITEKAKAQIVWTKEREILAAALKFDVCNMMTADRDITHNQDTLDKVCEQYSIDCGFIRDAPRPHDIARLDTEISELNGQIIARRFDLEQLMVGAGKCSKCRTNVSIEHILRHRELLGMELTALNEKVSVNRNALSKIISEWEIDVKNSLDARTSKFNETKLIYTELLSELKVLRDGIDAQMTATRTADIALGPAPSMAIYGIEQRRLAVLAQKSSKELELNNWDAAEQRYNDYHSVISATQAKISAAEYEIKHLRILDRLFGDKGIKAFKLDSILAMLNQSLDKYIDIISDGSVKVWVSQYREKTDGELATDLQIIVREGHKHDVPFALYSGGERQQITLAFIGAFWNLASMCGSGVNLLCLDEIFGPLDEYNTTNVFNYLEHMRINGKASIFIVTHNEHIKQQVKFDQIWTVTKKDHMSTLTRNKI